MTIARAYNGQQYTRELGSAAYGSKRIYDPDYALVQDPNFYEKLRRYPPVAGSVDLRKRMVAGSDWYLEPASSSVGDRAAVPIFETLLKQIQGFETARYNLAEALIKGSTWAAIEGEWRLLEIPPLPPTRWWVITSLRDMDKRRFCLLNDGGASRTATWHVEDPKPPYQPKPIDRSHYVRVAYGLEESTLLHGRGLAETLVYPFWYATSLDEHSAQFGERWAQGFRIWRLGDVPAPSAAAKRSEFLNVVDEFVSRYAAVVGEKDSFELHDAPAEALNYITSRQEYYNALMRVLILGSSLMTDPQVQGGSFALGDSQFENTTQLIVHQDRSVLDEACTADLVGLLWRANYQCFLDCGIKTTGPAFFHTGDLKQNDPAKRIPVIESAVKLGLRVRQDEAYKDYALTPPSDTEPVIEPPGEELPNEVGRPPNPDRADRTTYPSQKKRQEEFSLPSIHVHGAQGMEFSLPQPQAPSMDAVASLVERAMDASRSTAEAVSKSFDRLAEAVAGQKPPVVNVSPATVKVDMGPVADVVAAAFSKALERRVDPADIRIKRDANGRIVGAEIESRS